MSKERDRDGTATHETAVDGGTDPATAARRRVLSEHRGTVEAVLAAADAVAAGWEEGFATDRDRVVDPMAAVLSARGTDAELVSVLAGAVAAAGYALRADPVPAPPYLAVTGRGPVLRGTVEDGRIVVELRTFAVERTGEGPRYVRRGADPEAVVSVELRGEGDPA